MKIGKWTACSLLALLIVGGAATCGEISTAEWESMKKEMAEMKKENSDMRKASEDLQSKFTPIKSSVEKALDSKMGPGAVVTKAGKLTISGLLQVWYSQIDNDSHGLFRDPANDINDTNDALDNDSFRIRRTELKFTIDIHPNVRGVIMADFAREASSFTPASANTGTAKKGLNGNVANVQGGVGAVPRMLQDAFITYHSKLPHHEIQIGQFKPPFGEEGIRSSGALDFVERSFIGQVGDARDQGITVKGSWWDKRIEYVVGAFNGAANYHLNGQQQNRNDDNDAKDVAFRFMIKPLKSECYGDLEIGGAYGAGVHGESANRNPVADPVRGLNRNEVNAQRYGAWMSYFPAGPVRGFWMRAEYAAFYDRNPPDSVIDLLDNDLSANGAQDNGQPFWMRGGYASIGYKIMDSRWSGDCPHWFKGFEFLARFDQFDNVQVANQDIPENTDTFYTRVYTAGINYYIKNENAKIQLNYNVVDDPKGDNRSSRSFHQVQNNNFMVNFQVAF